MLINWNQYLSRYQQSKGGLFFGAMSDAYDSHLILTEGEETPLLVWVDTDPSDDAFEHNILARAMVQLQGEYDLHIQPRTLVGGFANFMKGDSGFGHSEAVRGRGITCSNKFFAQQILADPGVCEGLSMWKKVYLKIRPAPQGNGWHVVEIADINFEGTPVSGSHWISDPMLKDFSRLSDEDREVLLQAGSRHFNEQMDAFLNFLRAARRAALEANP